MDVMEFFERSAGKWRSQRTTHHLPFRRAETGDSEIWVETLAADHPKIAEICTLHEVDPALAIGGAYVTWQGTMEWDREDDENHQGSTVFALVPDIDNPAQGKLLRERGYAEIVPVIGHYQVDEDGGLVLTTEYETMSSEERFWFVNANLRCRSSSVKRFGGFSTASFCTEFRVDDRSETPSTPEAAEPPSSSSSMTQDVPPREAFSVFGW